MPVIQIDSADDPRIAEYRNVPDPVLLRERGLFVAEGRLVVRLLLDESRHRVRSLLVSPPALDALGTVPGTERCQAPFVASADLPVYVAPVDVLAGVVGFNIHRGCLALGERPPSLPVDAALSSAGRARLIVIAEQVSNADNIGALFRNARAFGAGCVLLSPGCCDPLYRKAVRVSIGATLRVPFAEVADWPAGLEAVRASGFDIIALTPHPDAREVAALAGARPRPVALLLGHEGAGLTPAALASADQHARIAMHDGVDSVNVATAAAIAMYVLGQGQR